MKELLFLPRFAKPTPIPEIGFDFCRSRYGEVGIIKQSKLSTLKVSKGAEGHARTKTLVTGEKMRSQAHQF